MNAPTALNFTHVPAPVFTLGTALRWLGHDCRNRCCSATIGDLDASVWFILRGSHFPTSPSGTLVLVNPMETGKSLARVRRLIYEVNKCTWDEAIHVLHRRTSEDGSVLVGSAGTEFIAARPRSLVARQTRGSSTAGQNEVPGSFLRTLQR